MSARDWRRALGRSQEDSPLDSVSDMMSGLMIVFLFVSIAFMKDQKAATDEASHHQKEAQKVADDLKESRKHLAGLAEKLNVQDAAVLGAVSGLAKEFPSEIRQHGLTLTFEDLTGDAQFDEDSAKLASRFSTTLSLFFPKLLDALYIYRDEVEELRIEGHTSSGYHDKVGDEAYLKNLDLSHRRAHAVAEFALSAVKPQGAAASWFRGKLVATGQSSNHLVLSDGCEPAISRSCEDKLRSRRVTLRVGTKTSIRAWEHLKALPTAASVGGP